MTQPQFPNIKTLFKDFTDRKKLMRSVARYGIRKIMFYRPDIYTHSLRVAWIIHSLMPNLKKAFGHSIDIDKTVIMALVHDDLEIITGDVQAVHKESMDDQQIAALQEDENRAIQELSKKFPTTVGNYNYQKLLTEEHTQKTLESQVLKLTDWLDAFGETLHEVYAGNITFTQTITDEYGTHPTPIEFYTARLNSFQEKHPKTKPLFKTESPFLSPLPQLDFEQISQQGQPHTKESIEKNIGHPHYDYWKHIIAKYASPKEYKELYTQKEFLKKL